MKRRLFLAVLGFAIASGWITSTPARACEDCYWHWLNPSRSYCRPVNEGEVGVTNCVDYVDIYNDSYCTESGTYCSQITAGGGSGGSGSGGGDGDACQTDGFCPAECFSCSGGGGGRSI